MTSRWHARSHVLALVVVLAVALALSERSSGFSADEGSYAIQAEAIRRGSWELRWPFREVDVEGAHFPYHAGVVDAGSEPAEYAYVSHPAWVRALSVLRPLGGEEVGLRLLSMAAVVGAAVCGGAMARRLGGEAAAPWGFWIVASSPAAANGLMLWAHAPSAAVAGLAALAAITIAAGPARWWWWVALAGAVAAGVALRSEGLLVAVVTAGALGLAGVARRDRRLAGAGVLAAAAGAGALVGERAWVLAIRSASGSASSRTLESRAGDDWIGGRLDGAWTVLLRGAEAPGVALVALVPVALLVLAVVAGRREAPRIAPRALVGAAAAVVALRLVVGVDDPVSGLLVAWPVVVLAGAALTEGARRPTTVALLLASGAVAAAVVATQYDDGGGLQWGGRYLSPLVVPLGAIAAVGLVRVLPGLRDRQVAAALLAVTAVLGLVVTDQVRRTNADAMDRVAATDQPVVLVAGEQIARLDWAAWPERCWLADDGDLGAAIRVLRTAGVRTAAYAGFEPQELVAAGASAARPDRPDGLVGVVDVGPGSILARTEHAFAGCDGPLG